MPRQSGRVEPGEHSVEVQRRPPQRRADLLQRPLDQALQHATTEMLTWLMSDYGYDLASASHLMGQTVGYDIGNVYNPAYTVVCRMRREVIERG